MRRLIFKKEYLKLILQGKKVLEGRVGYENIKKLKTGEIISLNGKYNAKIIKIQKFSSFKEALNINNYKKLLPNASSIDDALNIYSNIYPLWKQEKLGVFILEIKYPL